MTKIRSVLIKYKFSFKENTAHSSYLYQKVFRSIYGYNQNVTKGNNKIYNYYRAGVVSNLPYIKSGKNSLILPIGQENELIEFFESGKNPTHIWKIKGDWNVEYKKDFIDVDIESVVKALSDLINNQKLINIENKESKLLDEINKLLMGDVTTNNTNTINVITHMKKIIDTNWFTESYKSSNELSNFYENYNKLKVKYNI